MSVWSFLAAWFVAALVVWMMTSPECPACARVDWEDEPDLRSCRGCGVIYEPRRGRWRYAGAATRYRMPGWRGLLFREDEDTTFRPKLRTLGMEATRDG